MIYSCGRGHLGHSWLSQWGVAGHGVETERKITTEDHYDHSHQPSLLMSPNVTYLLDLYLGMCWWSALRLCVVSPRHCVRKNGWVDLIPFGILYIRDASWLGWLSIFAEASFYLSPWKQWLTGDWLAILSYGLWPVFCMTTIVWCWIDKWNTNNWGRLGVDGIDWQWRLRLRIICCCVEVALLWICDVWCDVVE